MRGRGEFAPLARAVVVSNELQEEEEEEEEGIRLMPALIMIHNARRTSEIIDYGRSSSSMRRSSIRGKEEKTPRVSTPSHYRPSRSARVLRAHKQLSVAAVNKLVVN